MYNQLDSYIDNGVLYTMTVTKPTTRATVLKATFDQKHGHHTDQRRGTALSHFFKSVLEDVLSRLQLLGDSSEIYRYNLQVLRFFRNAKYNYLSY